MKKIIYIIYFFLTGCEYVNSNFPLTEKIDNFQYKESKAVGSGCRYSKRNLEDCFQKNKDFNKKGIVDGWKESNEYLKELKN